MAIPIKSQEQLKLMRISGEIVARTHELLEKEIRPGVTTVYLNGIAEEYILSQGAIPSFKGYNGYPAAICVSINEEVIHGIPGLKKLHEGDIVSIDIGAFKNGFHGDAARTHAVGKISEEAAKLIAVTKGSFFEGISQARENNHLNDICSAVQAYVEANGFSVVRDFVGHGIGKKMHEEPQVPNYRMPSRGPRLVKGMAMAVEPMVNIGGCDIKILRDGWTVITRDGTLSAHYENTFVITDGEAEILTLI